MTKTRALELLSTLHTRGWYDDEWREVQRFTRTAAWYRGTSSGIAIAKHAGLEWDVVNSSTPENRLIVRAAYADALAKGE